MNLDKLLLIFTLSLSTLLFAPFLLLNWIAFGFALFALIMLFKRKFALMLIAMIAAFYHVQIKHYHQQSTDFSPYSVQETILIQKILKQQDEYQTAIAKRPNDETIFVRWRSQTPLHLHHHYQVKYRLRPLYARQNIGNFDRLRWLLAQRLSGQTTITHAEDLGIYHHWRSHLVHYHQNQTISLDTQGIILALAFGERAWIEQEQWQLFQHTATAHLIAISGLHIGLVSSLGFLLAKGILYFLWQIPPLAKQFYTPIGSRFSRYFSTFLSLLFAFSYSALAGFSAPTSRAIIALIILTLCHLFRKHYTAWQYLLRVVALLLFIDPLYLLSDSFWLSILAVASLIFWYQHFPLHLSLTTFHLTHIKSPLLRFILGLIHLQTGILLCFTPIQIYFFEGFSHYAFIANLLIVPLFSFLVVPLTLFSLFTQNIFYTHQLTDYLLQISLKLLTPLSKSWITLSQTEQYFFILTNCALLFLLLFIRYRQKNILLLFLLFPIIWSTNKVITKINPPPLGSWLHFDIGQGLAMGLLYTEENQQKIVLYDTGASWKTGSMAKMEIIPYLKRHHIQIEAIIVSHDDNDHSGGVTDLLTYSPNALLITPSQIHYVANQIEHCLQNKRWQFGNFMLRAISPHYISAKAKNAHSCIILVEIGQHRFLLTGDSESNQEYQYADKIGHIDLLQVPHHGSKTSTSEYLLQHIRPQIAIISAQRYNHWKMPNEEVIQRLRQHHIPPLNTADLGMIQIQFYPTYWKLNYARSPLQTWYRHLPPQKHHNN